MKELLLRISQQGVHGLYLMVFTLLIWLIFFLILAANPHKKLHQWCFLAGLSLSLGTLKEFLYYELGALLPHPVLHAIPDWLYSVCSGCFYFLSLPCGLVFAFYFSRANEDNLTKFRTRQILCFVPALLAFCVFPYTQILQYQSSTIFCLVTASYNWLYGAAITFIIIRTVRQERLSPHYRQRMLAISSILIPVWCWLILGFPYHAIGLEGVSKAWQLNLLVVAAILVFMLYHIFHDGIWGLHIQREHYDWDTSEKRLPQNAHYVGHSLKNDLAKIAWCTDLLSKENAPSKELDIIKQSVSHLENFTTHTQLYSDKIVIKLQPCNVAEIFDCLKNDILLPDNKQLQIYACDSAPLLCDPIHLYEMLQNLVYNAAEAIKEDGIIQLAYHYQGQRRQAIISVSDNGCGIAEKDLNRLSEPFYTTKNNDQNMGLGLYYCWNVMCAHSGKLHVKSVLGEGSTFSLYFPL